MLNLRRQFLPALAVILTAVALPSEAAQTKTAAAKTEAELAAAKKAATDAQHKLTTGQQELAKAEAAHPAALAKLQHERQRATQEHGGKLGLFQASSERTALHSQSTAIFDSLVTAIKGSSEYKSAAEAAATASDQLKEVRENAALDDATKSKRTSELSALIRRPAEIERQQLDADPKLREARQKEGEAAKKIAEIQPQVTKAVEADAGVLSALKAERESAGHIAKAREHVALAQKELTAAQATIAHDTAAKPKAKKK